MKNILIDFKLFLKKIITSSDLLSAIRRKYTYFFDCFHFRNMKNNYLKNNLNMEVKKYHNIHLGERCFIIGNGPSLNVNDLNMIKNEYTIASNRVYLIYDQTDWRPSYYMCQDAQLLRSLKDYYSNCKENIWLSYRALYDYNINIENATYYLLDTRKSTKRTGRIEFSSEISQSIMDGGTVTYSAIQLAIYMGFKKIYLLGVDHNFTHTLDKNRRVIKHEEIKEDYFDARYKDVFKQFEEKGKVYAAPDKELMEFAYSKANRFCNSHKIEIYNATRGGSLEIFPRINLENVVMKNENSCSCSHETE